MSTQLPESVPVSSVREWSETVGVLVVGFGIAGGCAAVEAAAAGGGSGAARTGEVAAAGSGGGVLVVERAAVAGGTSALAGGHFYLGGGTAVQRATGHPDSAEEMYRYLVSVSRDPELEKIRAYCDDSVSHFEWLEGLGFEFERSYHPEKAVIQPGTEGLLYSGNEQVWPYREQAVPAPRGHKVPVPGEMKGAGMLVDLLVKRASALGVQVRYETGATALVVDDAGRVIGVTWRKFGETGAIRADAVILAAGGFVMNREMVAAYVPQLASKPFVLGSTYDDGLGIRLGMSVGGATRHLDQAFITAPVYPPASLLTGIIVNRYGDRFVAEDSYHSRTSAYVLEQPGSAAYLIADSVHIEHPEFPLAPFIDGWESVAEMEHSLDIPPGRLAATLDRYNTYAARGEDPDFHKAPEWLAPQDTGPWGAFDLTLGKALYAGFTLGGLRTSVDGEVLHEDGTPIPGLYAAGACAANIAQDGKGYASGTQLGEGSYFGRRAGRHAAGVR